MWAKMHWALWHVYEHAEMYTMAFASVVIPLGVIAFYRLIRTNSDLFGAGEEHGTN